MKLTRKKLRKIIFESLEEKTTEQRLVDLLFMPSHAMSAVYMGEFTYFLNIVENNNLENKTISFDLNPKNARLILDALGMVDIKTDGKIYKTLARRHPEGNVYLAVQGKEGVINLTLEITESSRLRQ